MATDPTQEASRGHRLVTPALLFFTGTILLLPGLTRGFILDEYKTWMNCLLPLDVLIRDRILSGHFPTYFVVAQLWSRVAGVAEWALRVPSVLMVAAAVPFVYDLCLRLWDRRSALFCAVVFAGHQLVVWMGQTARPYAGLLLFSVVGAWCLVRWLKDGGTRYLAGLFVSTIAGLSFMPLFGLTPLSYIVACAFGFRRSRRAAAAAAALVISLVIMAIPMLHLGRNQEKFQVRSGVEGSALLSAVDGVQDLLFGDFDSWGRGGLAYLSLALMVVLVVWVLRSSTSEKRNSLPMAPEALALAWFAVPTLALVVAQGVTQKNLLGHERYYAPALGGITLVIGRGVAIGFDAAKGCRPWRWLVIGSAVGLLTANTVAWWLDKGEGPRETASEMVKEAGGIPKNVAGHVRWLRYELDGQQPHREFYLERGDARRVDSLLALFMNPGEGDRMAYYGQRKDLGDIPLQLAGWAAGESFWLFVYLNGRDALDRLAKEPPPGYRRVKKLENLDARAYLFEAVNSSGLDDETTEAKNQGS